MVLIVLYCEAQEPAFSKRGYPTWSRYDAEYNAKKFLIDNIFGKSSETKFFEIDALSTTATGEVYTVAYNSQDLKVGGLIFTFWGAYSNEYGVSYSDYESKNLNKDSAILLLDRLDRETDYISNIRNQDFNTYFTFSDMTFVLNKYTNGETSSIKIRVFWKHFDAEITTGAIQRSKRRMDKWFKSK